MIISKKSMLSTAVRAALIGAIAIPMVGCDDSETYNQQSYEEAQENYTQQQRQQLVGNVQGVVLDSNGNPLAGANVSIGTQATTTDALGYYAFADVAAVNVVKNADDTGLNSENANKLVALPIEVSVSAAGHLGGRTQVYPTAISDTEQFVYIDGFTAQAKNLYLPELDASVKATLRSTVTGEAIANQEVTLEFDSVNTDTESDDYKNSNPGVGEFKDIASTYFSVTTDANGAFEASNLPANSTFQVLVEDYRVDSNYVRDEVNSTDDDGSFTTAKEAIVANWGEIFVTKEIVADKIAPFVRNINGASAGGRLEKGKLGTTATGGLVFDFSESVNLLHKIDVNSLDSNTIKVVFLNPGDQSGATDYVGFTHSITSNGSVNSIRLNLAQEIAPGQTVNVYFERADFVDAGDNKLKLEGRIGADAVPALDAGLSDGQVNDSYKTAGQLENNYIKYTLIGYQGSSDIDDNFSIVQDITGTTEFSALSNHNAAFVDVKEGSNAIEQLNHAGDNTAALLLDLAQKLATKAGEPVPAALSTTTAKVNISFPANTVEASISIQDVDGQAVNSVIILPNLTTADHGVDFNGTTSFYIEGVVPGSKVIVTAEDVFGVKKISLPEELEEHVAPTTVIQNSYLVENDKVTGIKSEGFEIDGGQKVTSGVAGSLGYPYLTITPGILDLDALVDNDNISTNSKGADTYDAGQFDSWDDNDIVTAVAFSENIAWKSSTPIQTQVVSSSDIPENLLTSFNIVNDVVANGGQIDDVDVANSQANDFVTFNVDNIFTLSNVYSDKVLSFNDLVVDTKGVGASAAKVVIRDALPPMIAIATLSERSGKQYLKISFNERIASKEEYTRTEEPLVLTIANGSGAAYVVDTAGIDFSSTSIEIENSKINIDLNSDLELNNLRINIADENGNDGKSQDRDYNYGSLFFTANNTI